MSEYELLPDVFVSVTPAGAYHAAVGGAYLRAVGGADLGAVGGAAGGSVGAGDDPAHRLLVGILGEPRTPEPAPERLAAWTGLTDPEAALALLHRVQSVGWVRAETVARDAPSARIEQDIPGLLRQLSTEQRALLADATGFQLASSGFAHESAEGIAALAADLAMVHARHQGLLHGNLRLHRGGIATVDAAGNSQLGLWPLAIGTHAFLLVVAGAPLFNHAAFADMVWGLTRRYAASA